jgi:hypothetical protein
MWWGHKLLIGFGLILFSAGLYLAYNSYAMLAGAIETEGTVVELTHRFNSSAMYPVVTFKDLDGKSHTYTSDTGSTVPNYHKGEKVRILFNPNTPDSKDSTFIDGFTEKWGAPLILLAMGSFFILLTLFVSYLMHLDEDAVESIGGDTASTVINTFLIIGIIVLGLGAYNWSTTYAFVSKAQRVDGSVIALRSFAGSSYLKYPVVRYTDHLGKERTLYSPAGSSQPPFQVGDKVTVLLDTSSRNYLDTATIESFFDIWGMATILLVIGGVFVLFTSAFKYVYQRGGEITFGNAGTD